MKPITQPEAERMTWAALQAIPVTTDAREAKPILDVFTSIQAIKNNEKRGELK